MRLKQQDSCLADKVRFIWDWRGTEVLHGTKIKDIIDLLLNTPEHIKICWFYNDKTGEIDGVSSFQILEEKVVSVSTIFKNKGCLCKTLDICEFCYPDYKIVRTRHGKQVTENLEKWQKLARAYQL